MKGSKDFIFGYGRTLYEVVDMFILEDHGKNIRELYTLTLSWTKIVLPKGWEDSWGGQKRNLTVYYGEYKCSGLGSNMSERVPWVQMLRDEEVQPFIGIHFIQGDTWLISP
ncbi:unnamed protein product [Vicia faba]|uniref:pectinesterase n=1 Tax=Vicia faba TaxID=3906 RepID=A0AAV1A217_VICFA|nr:unnamed protein product [Vicia faba]